MKTSISVVVCLILSLPLGMALGYYGAKGTSEMQARVLIVQQTYDGPVELAAGDLVKFQYRQPFLYIEFTDLQADGIFRNGFDNGVVIPIPPDCESGVVCR